MKNTFSKLLILGIVSCSMVNIGCKKDDTTEKDTVLFEFNAYSLTKGFVSERGARYPKKASKTYQYDVVLVGSGLSFNAENEKFNGQGDYIFFSMYSLDSESLVPGKYTYDRFVSNDSLTIDDCVFGMNSVFSFGTDLNILKITNGVVDVKLRGKIYQFDFVLYTENNREIKGSYSGILEDIVLDYGIGVGNFTFKGTDRLLNHGELEYVYHPNDTPPYNYDLDLDGPGTLGSGNSLQISFYSPIRDGLEVGIYKISNVEKEFNMFLGFYELDHDPMDMGTGYFGMIDDGTVKITRDRKIYTIEYDLYSGVERIQGVYSGLLEFSTTIPIRL